MLDEYPGQMNDFADMVIQFGYTTMFISVFPLAALVSLANNYIMLRFGGWKLCHIFQRPVPKSAEDIGRWQVILEIVSVVSVIVNAVLIAFTGSLLQGYSSTYRAWSFIVIILSLLGVKRLLEVLIPDVPDEVQIQLERQALYVDKLIYDKEDLDEEELVQSMSESYYQTDAYESFLTPLIRHDSGNYEHTEQDTTAGTGDFPRYQSFV